jgi:hypothetical protein
MAFWIGFGIFAAAAIVVGLYPALVIASRADDYMEERYYEEDGK